LFAAAAVAGGLAAAGCGGRPPEAEKAAPAGPRQKLEVWRPGAKEDKPWGVTIDEVLMDFAKSQNRWDVDLIYPGDGYDQKITTQVVAGNPPAAFRGWVRSIQSMAPTSQLTALDGFVKNEKGFKQEDFWPAAIAMGSFQGKLFGIPKTVQPQVLYFSRRRLREAGIDVTKLPDTLEDWAALGDKLFEKSGESYARVGFVPWIPGVNAPAFLPEFGADWFDAKNMKVTANTPECIACFEWHKSFADRYSPTALDPFVAANNAGGWGRYSKTGAMHTGLVAIFQHAGWWLGSALEWAEKDLDLTYRPVPRAKNAKSPKASQMTGNEWMMPAGAPTQEGGWSVLKWMATEQVMLKMAIMDTLLPGRKSVTNHPDYAKQPFSKVWTEVAVSARPEDIHVSASLMTQRLNAALNDVIRGKQNAKDALDAVTREVQADLDSKKR
jgi:ABC-type glycerol-3-phosphate transport system substrate-binding protein